jgi:hypothetical protein
MESGSPIKLELLEGPEKSLCESLVSSRNAAWGGRAGKEKK